MLYYCPLNRQVVGSIPTASTKSFIINALQGAFFDIYQTSPNFAKLRRIVIGGLSGATSDASRTPLFSLRRFSVNPADRFGIVFLPNGCRRFDA
jgi:hypothetical protein